MRLTDCRLMKANSFAIERGVHPTDALFYILEGSFSLYAEGRRYTVKENDAVFFPSDMEFERYMISPITFYNVRIEDGEGMPRGVVTPQNTLRMISTLSYMTQLTPVKEECQELLDHLLEDIFAQLRVERMLENKRVDPIVQATLEYFERNLQGKLELARVASAVGVSVSGLIQHFRSSLNTTPIKYLNRMRMKRAEALLCSTDYTLGHIASICGYDNAFYFSNAFKKENGISPKEYRKNFGV